MLSAFAVAGTLTLPCVILDSGSNKSSHNCNDLRGSDVEVNHHIQFDRRTVYQPWKLFMHNRATRIASPTSIREQVAPRTTSHS